MPAAIPIIGAVAGVAGTVASVVAQRRAAKAQQQQQRLATQQSRRQAIRQAQILRARAMNTAQGVGAMGSSAVSGGVSSLGSQLGSELGFSSQMSGLSNRITQLNTRAQTFSAIGQLGFWGYQNFGQR